MNCTDGFGFGNGKTLSRSGANTSSVLTACHVRDLASRGYSGLGGAFSRRVGGRNIPPIFYTSRTPTPDESSDNQCPCSSISILEDCTNMEAGWVIVVGPREARILHS